ncbi:flavin reductase family protein [Gibbsiella quercinecans]|uniref:flavin reductase family protein n=1 Tax=Gibbsiella quercinecans TaxID=929813 RepID=UPI00243135FE|nr:flavin reductase family protein [Gibbsiella quercinecans]
MIDIATFKQAMSSFPSGVTVITVLNEQGKLTGMTVSAFSSLSLEPPLVLFCPDYRANSYPVLMQQKKFAIHILTAEQEQEAWAFASKSSDKSQGINWQLSALGNPLLENALTTIECELWREYAGGDHAIVVGEVKNILFSPYRTDPMIYCRGKILAPAQPA